MGQYYSSEYTIQPELEEEILDKHHKWESFRDEYENTVFVNMNCESPEDRQSPKYRIDIDSQNNRDARICLIFPSHPVEKYRLLWTSDYKGLPGIDNCQYNLLLQKTINRRFLEAESNVMAVGLRKTLFILEGVVGHVYIVWAKTVNCVTINNIEAIKTENTPIFVELDGYGRYRNVFVFPKENDPERDFRMTSLNVKNFDLFEPHMVNLFCMEADPRVERDTTIRTMTHQEAHEIVSSEVDRMMVSMDGERGPYPLTSDDE